MEIAIKTENLTYFYDAGQEETEIPLLEQDLLKLMLLETRFAKLPDDMDESIFTSSAGKTIYRRLLELDDNTDYVDIGRIEDALRNKQAAAHN